jgi:hypothetical protein
MSSLLDTTMDSSVFCNWFLIFFGRCKFSTSWYVEAKIEGGCGSFDPFHDPEKNSMGLQ